MKKVFFLLVFSVVFSYGWSKVSSSECKNGGGTMEGNECKANWEKSSNICKLKGLTLPYLFELMVAKKDKYDKKLFLNSRYWSSNNNLYKKNNKTEKGSTYWVQDFRKGYGIFPLFDYDQAFVKCSDYVYYEGKAFSPQ